MGGTVLIAAVKYVCVLGGGGGGGGECGGCDCVGVGVIVWLGVGVIAWVWKGVCGRYSLNCCCKVCVCQGRGGGGRGWREGGSVGGSVGGCDCVGVGVIVWVGVGVIAWVWKGVCGRYSLNCCCKVYMCVEGGRGVWGV